MQILGLLGIFHQLSTFIQIDSGHTLGLLRNLNVIYEQPLLKLLSALLPVCSSHRWWMKCNKDFCTHMREFAIKNRWIHKFSIAFRNEIFRTMRIFCTLIFDFWKKHYLLEMSSSWNFPARASPSYKGSEPRHINFRAETELTIPTICMSKNHNFLPLSSL